MLDGAVERPLAALGAELSPHLAQCAATPCRFLLEEMGVPARPVAGEQLDLLAQRAGGLTHGVPPSLIGLP